MIKFNLFKIGIYGVILSVLLFLIPLGILVCCLPEGEAGLIWLIQLGLIAIVAKFGFIISAVMVFVGLMTDRYKHMRDELDQ